jgi:hypothetical protein
VPGRNRDTDAASPGRTGKKCLCRRHAGQYKANGSQMGMVRIGPTRQAAG